MKQYDLTPFLAYRKEILQLRNSYLVLESKIRKCRYDTTQPFDTSFEFLLDSTIDFAEFYTTLLQQINTLLFLLNKHNIKASQTSQ